MGLTLRHAFRVVLITMLSRNMKFLYVLTIISAASSRTLRDTFETGSETGCLVHKLSYPHEDRSPSVTLMNGVSVIVRSRRESWNEFSLAFESKNMTPNGMLTIRRSNAEVSFTLQNLDPNNKGNQEETKMLFPDVAENFQLMKWTEISLRRFDDILLVNIDKNYDMVFSSMDVRQFYSVYAQVALGNYIDVKFNCKDIPNIETTALPPLPTIKISERAKTEETTDFPETDFVPVLAIVAPIILIIIIVVLIGGYCYVTKKKGIDPHKYMIGLGTCYKRNEDSADNAEKGASSKKKKMVTDPRKYIQRIKLPKKSYKQENPIDSDEKDTFLEKKKTPEDESIKTSTRIKESKLFKNIPGVPKIFKTNDKQLSELERVTRDPIDITDYEDDKVQIEQNGSSTVAQTCNTPKDQENSNTAQIEVHDPALCESSCTTEDTKKNGTELTTEAEKEINNDEHESQDQDSNEFTSAEKGDPCTTRDTDENISTQDKDQSTIKDSSSLPETGETQHGNDHENDKQEDDESVLTQHGDINTQK